MPDGQLGHRDGKRCFAAQGRIGGVSTPLRSVRSGIAASWTVPFAYEGTPVVAPVNGLVLASGFGESAGWNVRIEDGTGRVHVLMHLQGRPTVLAGERVRSGQSIGTVGRTGNAASGGPHIHYEIRDGADTIDPMPWLRATGSTFVAPAASDFHSGSAPAFSGCDTRA